MKNIIILGTGGLAAQLTFYIEDNNSKVGNEDKINILGYIDYEYNIEKYWKRYNFKTPVLCDVDSYIPKENEEVLLAISNVKFRNKMIDILVKKNARIGSFIHSTVIISKSQKFGFGNIVMPFCEIEPNSQVGDNNILTPFSFISHDSIVGSGNFLSKAGIAGHTEVGNNNYFGLGSVVIPNVKIGNNNVIIAGTVVNESVNDDTTVFYQYKEQVLGIPK
ncbi:LbetaH domain-containing protein [Eudoraea adriatica]|uniref:hypothetical protein n=1 Tax=Eudoraea adriatica TaxID=446681 RepID=UPI00037BAB82|nr:hypothetical protein [Eudoraea adriatica]